MPVVKVHLPPVIDRSYGIEVQPGALESLAAFILRLRPESKVFLITDSHVEKLWGRTIQRKSYEAGLETLLLSFPAGEKSKHLRTVHALHTQLLAADIRRDSLVVALGGGVVGDVAGYVAATVLRGVAYIHVPTTLLAQVDSSVGGKVGINHPRGKNLIGAFHQPLAVFIDPDVLKTLPQREFRSGLAEVVKIAAALDRRLFEFLERNAARMAKSNPKLLTTIISRCVALKAAVVEADEFESGLRKALNLGHTIGHAIESSTSYSINHGEAVALGLVAESTVAHRVGLLRSRELDRLISLLKTLGLPTRMPPLCNTPKFFSALSADKKSVGNSAKYVLLSRIGRCAIGVDVPISLVRSLLKEHTRVRS
ncbi:MAG: 3-dehydroquinate synthase [Bacteroidetes bacterium]|nr:3-dehydroquinate synthase [Bacteroidota bacterium]MCW5894472.1 3-dehydroquinate synthase [Bacteroidota bacterium]